jgi:leucyl aminopeptidase
MTPSRLAETALSYAVKQNPDEIIDIATLTGAVVTALGRAAAGIMGSNRKLMESLVDSGKAAGEKFWPLPLFDEYKESLKSDLADLKNAGSKGEASTSCAGMFLKEFVNGKPWAHLDIAGPAWMDKAKDELNKGGTAFGVRTLVYYLLDGKEATWVGSD